MGKHGARRAYKVNPITQRQWEILGHIEQGLSNSAIGRKMNVGSSTIESAIDSICSKLLVGTDVPRKDLPRVAREKFGEKENA